jgi:hypothetical protein
VVKLLRLSMLHQQVLHPDTRLEQHVVHMLVDTGECGASIRAAYSGTMFSML